MPVCMLEEQMNTARDEDRALRVCFVCTGNTCRSPMAEAVANHLSRQRKNDAMPIIAASAGLYANDGEPIARNAAEALRAAGITPTEGRDYRLHTAHTLTAQEVEKYDLLVGLGGSHCMELLMRFPQAAQRIVGMPTPIADPFGGDLATYAACLEQITAGVKTLLFSSEPEEERHDG